MNSNTKKMKFLLPAFAILLSSLFSSCGPVTPNPNATKPLTAIFINPHESGTYKYFKVNHKNPKWKVKVHNLFFGLKFSIWIRKLTMKINTQLFV